jgi:hypothetical protein
MARSAKAIVFGLASGGDPYLDFSALTRSAAKGIPPILAPPGIRRARTVDNQVVATFGFDSLTALHAALDRVYKLGVSLPDAPLNRFRAQTGTSCPLPSPR